MTAASTMVALREALEIGILHAFEPGPVGFGFDNCPRSPTRSRSIATFVHDDGVSQQGLCQGISRTGKIDDIDFALDGVGQVGSQGQEVEAESQDRHIDIGVWTRPPAGNGAEEQHKLDVAPVRQRSTKSGHGSKEHVHVAKPTTLAQGPHGLTRTGSPVRQGRRALPGARAILRSSPLRTGARRRRPQNAPRAVPPRQDHARHQNDLEAGGRGATKATGIAPARLSRVRGLASLAGPERRGRPHRRQRRPAGALSRGIVACPGEFESGWRRHSAARARRADAGIAETMSRRRPGLSPVLALPAGRPGLSPDPALPAGSNAAPAVEGKPGAFDSNRTGQ